MPVQSYYVQAGYFVTGETVSSRGVVKPIRDLDLRKGKFGLGALELAARFNPLNFGNQVFTGGLADPNLWTNNLYTIDLGVNWYWTQYIKVTLDWEHAVFGNPVTYRPQQVPKDEQRGDPANADLLLTAASEVSVFVGRASWTARTR